MSCCADGFIFIRGAGDIATGIAWRLYASRFRRLILSELPQPIAVRRLVSFSEALYEGEWTVEGVTAVAVRDRTGVEECLGSGRIPVLVDANYTLKDVLRPDVIIDATLSKKNDVVQAIDAALVIGVGPGFYAGRDTHAVIETHRGHNLGRVIWQGSAEEDTGIPGEIAGEARRRVIRAPSAGILSHRRHIGESVRQGEILGHISGTPVRSDITGTLRGWLRDGSIVYVNMKIGDVDPRNIREHCRTISDKSRAIAGGVLEAIMAQMGRERATPFRTCDIQRQEASERKWPTLKS